MRTATPFLIILVLFGCRAAEFDLDPGYEDRAGDADADADADGDADADADADPEIEDDFLELTPAQTDTHVYIANPGRDTLVRVDAFTQEVVTIPVGRGPAEVWTSPDNATVAVFNAIGDSVSLVDTATLETTEVPVRDELNRMVPSPDGRWLVLFHDQNAVSVDDPAPSGLQSFNEVSFVDVEQGEHQAMAVGFNPRDVQFTPDGSLAAIISDESLALVDLDADPLTPTIIRVTDVLVDPPIAEEVVLSPDGSWAFVRQFGADWLVLVDLSTAEIIEVPMGANPTDMDLSPDGSTLAVVARTSSELWLFDIDDPRLTPTVVPLPLDLGLGSLQYTPDGRKGILYTNGALVDRYATWDTATDEVVLRSLVKPVRSVGIAPDSETLLVFHTQDDAPDAEHTSPFFGHWALTMIDLTQERSNPLLLPAEPRGYANSDSGDVGYFVMRDQSWLEVLHYGPLLHDEVPLKSDPVWLGVMPDDDPDDGIEPPAWVSQEHALGRISFFEDDTATLETITGFELNSAIED